MDGIAYRSAVGDDALTMLLKAAILFFCIAMSPICDAQVYAVGPHRGPLTTVRVDDQRWFAKGFPGAVGIVGFRAAPDWKPQTEIYAGLRVYTFPASAYAVLFIFGALVIFAMVTFGKIAQVIRIKRNPNKSIVTSSPTIK